MAIDPGAPSVSFPYFFKSSLTLSSVATNVSPRGCHLPCVSQSPGASVGALNNES